MNSDRCHLAADAYKQTEDMENCAPGVQFSMSSVCLQASASTLHLSEFNRESCEFLNTVNVYDFKWTYLIIQTTTHTKPTNITADLTMHSTKSGILKIRI